MKTIIKKINFFFVSILVLATGIFLAERTHNNGDVGLYQNYTPESVYADIPATGGTDTGGRADSDGGDAI
jgi:hypothetical protein